MHASHTGFVARTVGLFTLIWLHGVTGGANGQVVCQATQDGVVAHASFELSSSDWEALVRLGEGVTLDASLDEAWEGVQILDDSEVWTACSFEEENMLSHLPVPQRPRRLTANTPWAKPTSWVSFLWFVGTSTAAGKSAFLPNTCWGSRLLVPTGTVAHGPRQACWRKARGGVFPPRKKAFIASITTICRRPD